MRAAILSGAVLLAACGGNAPTAGNSSNDQGQAEAISGNSVQVVEGTVPPANLDPAAACTTQGGKQIPANKLRALGTEPFWSAVIDGRCVTYSTPENQSGTRVWAKFHAAGSRTWSGSLDGRPFKLSIKEHPDCSDGMSDKSFPLEATLRVNGEERRGCAEPR